MSVANLYLGHDTYCPPSAQQFTTTLPNNFYLPHNPGPAAPLTAFPHLGTNDHNYSWHLNPSLPQSSPRHQATSPQTPRIQVTPTAGSNVYTQPLQDIPLFDNIYQQTRQPQALQTNFNNFDFAQQQYMMDPGSLSPSHVAMQIPRVSVKHERTVSINSVTDLPTPVTIGLRSPLLSPTSGEQTHRISSPQGHRRQISEDSSSQSGEDDNSLRRLNHSYKRAEEPSRNSDNKMVCRFQECTGLAFDRKCEWS